MTVTAPLDQTCIRTRLHQFAMETATASMVTGQMKQIAEQSGYAVRSSSTSVMVGRLASPGLVTCPSHETEPITAEVESVYDGEMLTVVILIRRSAEYHNVEKTIAVTSAEFNHDWEGQYRLALASFLGG